jgi:DNA-binding LacI/PurR family transcriptional regulator
MPSMNLLSSKSVTLQDIANEVGVHKSTVQRALHGDPRVEAGTIARINEVATRMGYDPEANHAARRLSLRKSGRGESTKLVALFFPLVSSRAPYFLRQFVGFMEVMSDAGYDVLTRILDRMGDQRLPPAVMRGDVDAMVALADPEWLTRQQNLFANMPAVRRPLITLINPVPGAWSATADFRQAGRMSIGHLLDLGHRRIISISNMSHQFAERVAGYRDELVARGLDPDRHLVALDCDNTISDWTEKVADAIDRLLAACPDATAFLAPNDQLAGLAITLFAERNRPVPEAMSLVGFDDTDPVPGPDHQNILTTVAVPLEQIGRQAARLALSPGDGPRTVVLPTGLRVRGTTRPPKTA